MVTPLREPFSNSNLRSKSEAENSSKPPASTDIKALFCSGEGPNTERIAKGFSKAFIFSADPLKTNNIARAAQNNLIFIAIPPDDGSLYNFYIILCKEYAIISSIIFQYLLCFLWFFPCAHGIMDKNYFIKKRLLEMVPMFTLP